MRGVLVEDLGENALNQYSKLSEDAAASASIGQVHRGLLDGREVAVKIQYPGVRESIDSDLRLLKGLAQGMISFTGRKMDLSDLFEELSTVLHQEADYNLEAANMKEFARLLAGSPDFCVPTPVESHTSSRVLTMSWEKGISVNEWLKTNPSRTDREKFGTLLLDLYCREFYEWGLVQTDPNYANFLIQPDPLKVVVLDFGATLRYTEEFRKGYVEFLQAIGSLDRQRIIRAFVEAGFIDERESQESKELFAELLILSLEPFQSNKQPFTFSDSEYAKRSREIGQRFSQSLKYSPPPRKILFLHRKLGGIFTLLKKMDVRLDVRPYWERMVGTRIGAG